MFEEEVTPPCDVGQTESLCTVTSSNNAPFGIFVMCCRVRKCKFVTWLCEMQSEEAGRTEKAEDSWTAWAAKSQPAKTRQSPAKPSSSSITFQKHAVKKLWMLSIALSLLCINSSPQSQQRTVHLQPDRYGHRCQEVPSRRNAATLGSLASLTRVTIFHDPIPFAEDLLQTAQRHHPPPI